MTLLRTALCVAMASTFGVGPVLAADPFGGVEVSLVENPDRITRDLVVTDADGAFAFSNVRPGAYCIRTGPITARRTFEYGKRPNQAKLTVMVGAVTKPAITPVLRAVAVPVSYCFSFDGPTPQIVQGTLTEQPSPLER